MRYLAVILISLLFANLIPAFSDSLPPTQQEQDLYNKLLVEFEKLNIEKRDVSDVLQTFEEPLVVTFPCDSTDLNDLVVSVVETKLARFDEAQEHEGMITGGTYTWKCTVTTTSDGKITMDCDNELKLNHDLMVQDTGKDPRIKQAENLLILYHEFLHGQLMIEAIQSSEKWRDDVCNKSADGKIDYSYSDRDHKIINPLQTEFLSQLITNSGGMMIVREIMPEEAEDGVFTKKLGNLHDYPQYVESGIHVTLRGSNLINTKFSSQNSDIILSGSLANKTQSGIAWLYIFGNPDDKLETQSTSRTEMSIPDWIKKNAVLWAINEITDSEFLNYIEYLIQEEIIQVPETQKQQEFNKIPNWFKQNAQWWYEEKIDDETFVKGIQYLISIKIISV